MMTGASNHRMMLVGARRIAGAGRQRGTRETMSDETKPTWTPILEGEHAELARQVALELVRDLGETELAPDASVNGEGGLALLFHYADLVFPGHGFDDQREERLTRVADMVSSDPGSTSLYDGFTGAAWCFEHVQPTDPTTSPDDDPLAEIDDALVEILTAGPWRGDFDLINGLVGHAVYALERGARPRTRECLHLIIDRLAELAHPRPEGVAWWTPPRELPVPTPGRYDLGVAHGVPGVIAVLAQIACVPEMTERARPLLDGAVSWLLTQRLPPGRGGAFPNFVDDPVPARSAWCYGDPGIAAALLAASRFAGEPAWQESAIEIGLMACERPVAKTSVADSTICHGAAGLGHLYNRLYQATGRSAFADAAKTWFAGTLALRRPGTGLSGYLSLIPDPPRTWDLSMRPDPTFLTGNAGIALSLMAAVSAIEPMWDRCLLADIPLAPLGQPRERGDCYS
jgi:hypothetical protein